MTELRAIDNRERTERASELIKDAATLADDTSENSPIIGYVVLAAYGDGTTRTCGFRPSTEDHRIGSAMWEAWMRETLNDDFTYRAGIAAACDVLNGDV